MQTIKEGKEYPTNNKKKKRNNLQTIKEWNE
jgi:hypothetical protein